LVQPTGDGLAHSVVEVTTQAGPDWAKSEKLIVPKGKTETAIASALPGVTHHARAYSVTQWQQQSAPTATQSLTIAADTIAPAVPTGLVAVGLVKALRVDWADNTEPDLSHYEVRYGVNSGSPTYSAPIRCDASMVVIGNLSDEVTYAVQVRSIDITGNASAYATKATATTVLTQVVENSTAEVIIDSTGLTIIDGSITVQNPGGTVIIDGTSDMFRIIATGTISLVGPNVSVVSSEVLLALGMGSLAPAHMGFYKIGTGEIAVPMPHTVLDATGAASLMLWMDTRPEGVTPFRTIMRLIIRAYYNASAQTFNTRYYILEQVAL
jgi:hypothetical protein